MRPDYGLADYDQKHPVTLSIGDMLYIRVALDIAEDMARAKGLTDRAGGLHDTWRRFYDATEPAFDTLWQFR
jgi:hypothetical protein